MSDRIASVVRVIFACLFLVGTAQAQLSADDLAKRADADLRSAQSLFFNGKRDESLQTLVKAHKKVVQLRGVNAADNRLKGLEGKVEKLKADLEKRMGGSIDLDTGKVAEKLAAPGAPTPVQAPTRAASTRLPHHADQAMSGALRSLDSVNGPYSRFDYYRERGEYDSIIKALDSIDEALKEVPAQIEEAKRLAAEKGVTEYPGFAEAYERLEKEKARSAETRKQTLKQSSATAAAGDAVSKDVESFATAYDRLRGMIFDRANGFAVSFTEPAEAGEFLAAIESFEKNEMAKAQKTLEDFAARYGNSRDAINSKVRAQGYQGNRLAGTIYEDFTKSIENISKTRKAMAEDLLRRAKEDLESLPKAHDFFRAERRDRVKDFSELAARYDSSSAEIRRFVSDMPARFDADIKALNEKIDARKWPGSISGKKAEEEAGMKFFKEDSDWGARPRNKEQRIPVAVAITGDWTVQKTDLLNRPVMYGVPALVAVEVPEEKAKMKVLRVYSVTLRTAEGANVKQAPPFREITVGDSYYIRPAAVR